MTNIEVYKSFREADKALDHYCKENTKNTLLICERYPYLVEGVTFNYLIDLRACSVGLPERIGGALFLTRMGIYEGIPTALFSSEKGPDKKYAALFGFDFLTNRGNYGGISLDALVKNTKKALRNENNCDLAGAKANPIFYTIEKEPGLIKGIKRIQASREGEDVSFLYAAFLDCGFGYRGLNTQERDEFVRLWDQANPK